MVCVYTAGMWQRHYPHPKSSSLPALNPLSFVLYHSFKRRMESTELESSCLEFRDSWLKDRLGGSKDLDSEPPSIFEDRFEVGAGKEKINETLQ